MAKILFFDGYCSLCNNLVDQMARWDKRGVLKFASLQGKTAKVMLPPQVTPDPDTVIYLRGGVSFERSTAILMSLRDLGGFFQNFPAQDLTARCGSLRAGFLKKFEDCWRP